MRTRPFGVRGLLVAALCGIVFHGQAQDSGFNWRDDATQFASFPAEYNAVATAEGSSRGWLVGSADTILRTENLGLEWTPLTSGLGSGYDWYGVDFADESTGWVVGSWAKVSLLSSSCPTEDNVRSKCPPCDTASCLQLLSFREVLT